MVCFCLFVVSIFFSFFSSFFFFFLGGGWDWVIFFSLCVLLLLLLAFCVFATAVFCIVSAGHHKAPFRYIFACV